MQLQANNNIEGQFRILVVDDDRLNRDLMHTFLKHYPHSTAENGEQAIKLLETEAYDLVLLDVVMPNMGGFEVLEHIRKHPALKTLPVILISSMDESADVVRGLELGANDYIPRPVDQAVLLARVKNQLAIKHLVDLQRQTIAELQQVETMRASLFKIASHDLKNPLSNIRIAEYLLRQRVDEETEEASHLLDTMSLAVSAMENVIEEFLDVAALQTGGVRIRLKPVFIEEAILDAVLQYTTAASNKRIQLSIEDVDGMVCADFARLRQVVSNLVSNAVKYSPQGSVVRIWSQRLDHAIRICIADQGPGIPEHERDYLFQEFRKLSPRPTGGEPSTGLGLWIVNHLTRLQGGLAGVDFPEEGGSVFWIELPATAAPEATPA